MILGSVNFNSGKTILSAYLMEEALERNLKVAYLKAFGYRSTRGEDEDILIMKNLFPRATCVSGVLLSPSDEERLIKEGDVGEIVKEIKKRYHEIREKFEHIFIEAPQGTFRGSSAGIDLRSLSSFLEEEVLLVERADEPYVEDRIIFAKNLLGESFLGVIINRVPKEKLLSIQEFTVPFLIHQGVNVLGVIPYFKEITGITLKELVEALKGEVLVGEGFLERVVSGIHIGSLPHDRALSRYRRNPEWAVLVSGSRVESIAAAIEARVTGIILTGGMTPGGATIAKAEAEGIPLIKVNEETIKVSEIVDELMSKSSVLKRGNFEKVKEYFEGKINLDVILGL